MAARSQNIWPFSRKAAPAKTARPARRSSMTVGEAARAAFKAGQQSGDTGAFSAWLESKGLDGRGDVLQARLRREYERGVTGSYRGSRYTATPKQFEKTGKRKTADDKNREFLARSSAAKATIYKGRTIEPRGDAWVIPSIDRESEFDSVADAKRFLGSWGKQNPARSREELERMDSAELDRMAFGFASGDVRNVPVSKLVPTDDDIENAVYKAQHYPGGPKAWARSVDFSEPIEVLLRRGKLEIRNGHHRYYAAKLLGKKTIRAVVNIDDSAIDAILAKSNPVTDRAHRYQANELVEGDRCLFCGSTRFLVPDHWDGHPDHTDPENLELLCKACNTAKGAAFKKAGRGRLTKQFNPTKGGGAANIGEWLQTVGAITPHVDRGDRGLSSTIGVREAVDMIRATPQHKRREYASKLRRRRNPDLYGGGLYSYRAVLTLSWSDGSTSERFLGPYTNHRDVSESARKLTSELKSQEAERRAKRFGGIRLTHVRTRIQKTRITRNPAGDSGLIREAETARSVEELARLHKYAVKGRHSELLAAVEARAVQLGIRHEELTEAHPRLWASNPSSEMEVRFRQAATPCGGFAADVAPTLRTGYRMERHNPAPDAAALYESFHGKPADQELMIEEEEHEHDHLAVLGRAVDCWIETPTGLLAHIEFEEEPNDPVIVTSAEDGKQLYFTGGDQAVNLTDLKMDGDEWVRDRMVLGTFARPHCKCGGEFEKRGEKYTCEKCRRKVTFDTKDPKDQLHNLAYLTRKDFDKFKPITYEHDLGEETGIRPQLEFDPRSKHLYIAGGQYFIKQPLFGTSPGIEN